MIQQSQFFSEPRHLTSLPNEVTSLHKPNVYFSYQSSPGAAIQQNIKITQQKFEEKRRRKIFQPRRKLSYEQSPSKKSRISRLKIFQPSRKRVETTNSQILAKYTAQDFLKENEGIFRRTNTQMALNPSQNNKHIVYDHQGQLFLKASVISGVDTIVDQLEELDENFTEKNPITRKLSNIKNRQTKRTYYSNTVKNSLMVNEKHNLIKRNRIQSEVMNYHYSPNPKYRSAVTIKAENTKSYGISKLSNGLSVLTNDNNPQIFSDFKDKQDVQTPRYYRSTYKTMRRSFEPSSKNDKERKESQKKNISILTNHPQTDRFYDQSSMETPRLPVASKKASYEVIDPLTSSLKKQKLERIQQKKLEQIKLAQTPSQPKKLTSFFNLFSSIIAQLVLSIGTSMKKGKQTTLRFLGSQLFLVMIIVVLSLTIFGIQLVQ